MSLGRVCYTEIADRYNRCIRHCHAQSYYEGENEQRPEFLKRNILTIEFRNHGGRMSGVALEGMEERSWWGAGQG